MAATTETQQQQAPAFDAKEYIAKANEREAERRKGGTPAPAAAAAPKPADATTDKNDDKEDSRYVSRSTRRELNKLREEAAYLRGKLDAVTAGSAAADPKTAPAAPAAASDPEPQRKDYGDDASFQKALAIWGGKQGANATLATEREQQAIRDNLAAAAKDAELFDDWETKREAVLNPDVTVTFSPTEAEPDWDDESEGGTKTVGVAYNPKNHPVLMGLLMRSKQAAAILYHLTDHPDTMWELLKAEKTPDSLIANFHQLEGELKVLYREKRKTAAQAGDDPKKEAAKTAPPVQGTPAKGTPSATATGAAALPKPSEAATAPGGQTPVTDLTPYLADGKTVNPAWIARRNERSGARR